MSLGIGGLGLLLAAGGTLAGQRWLGLLGAFFVLASLWPAPGVVESPWGRLVALLGTAGALLALETGALILEPNQSASVPPSEVVALCWALVSRITLVSAVVALLLFLPWVLSWYLPATVERSFELYAPFALVASMLPVVAIGILLAVLREPETTDRA